MSGKSCRATATPRRDRRPSGCWKSTAKTWCCGAAWYAKPAFRWNDVQKDRGLRHMRLVATGLLLLAVLIYGLSTFFGRLHPVMGYIAAFSEAAVVGAIPDWFAGVALFPH